MSHAPYTLWQDAFVQERTRLLAALGELTEGGVVEALQHIGATSVPGLPASPCIDIGLAVWPFPLEAERRTALEALGYNSVPGFEAAPEQRFRHESGRFQLFIVDAGSEKWTEYLLVRDYLRHSEAGRQERAAFQQEWAEKKDTEAAAYTAAKADHFEAILKKANVWWPAHHGFAPVEAVIQELSVFPCPYYISSGWAIDLFLGRVTRVHHDIDVAIARCDQLVLQQYMTERGWKFVTPHEQRLEPWPTQMRLELPRHQAHAHREGAMIDFLISEIEHDLWRFRRAPSIVRTVERLTLRTETGIPFLAPEVVLLFKRNAVNADGRSKDKNDFESVRTLLEPERKAWLRWALTTLDPEHPWITALE